MQVARPSLQLLPKGRAFTALAYGTREACKAYMQCGASRAFMQLQRCVYSSLYADTAPVR